ncbi:MAG TPA: hypothetical protein VEG34_17835, partial [Thermoanaerobaculia bacterium]|nr:hypothetical protein [Thermoanaerobaculia bacterium]
MNRARIPAARAAVLDGLARAAVSACLLTTGLLLAACGKGEEQAGGPGGPPGGAPPPAQVTVETVVPRTV